MALITYDDKQDLGTQPSIPDVNKVTADNMNEIKQVVNELNPVVLYNNSSGSNSTITLSDDVNNYSYIEIFYKSNDDYVGSKKLIGANCNTDLVSYQPNRSSDSDIYMKFRVITINNNTISTKQDSNGYFIKEVLLNANGYQQFANNYIYITRVLGYK